MAKIKTVAKLAGVSPSSVSRVLNNHPNVSDDLRARVLKAVEAHNYRPDVFAAGLRNGASRTIGVVISDIVNPLFAEIVEGLEEGLRAYGYSIILTHSHGDSARDLENIRLLQHRRVDGLVLSLASEKSPALQGLLREAGEPVVLLDREVGGVAGTNAVLTDHRYGLSKVTGQLLDAGHRRVALITGSPNTRPGREREAGFMNAFAERRLTPDPLLLFSGAMSVEVGEHATSALFDHEQRPSAVVTSSNLQLIGALRAFQKLGLAVGRDVAIATCDDVPIASLHSPPITVVARDTRGIGREAASILLAHLGGPPGPPRIHTVPTTVIQRSSTVLHKKMRI